MSHDGGYVRDALPFPGRPGVTAVIGTWSGGSWDRSPVHVRQYRGLNMAGTWRIVGVDVPLRSRRSPVLLMEPSGGGQRFEPGDVVTFGETRTAFTFFDIRATTLPIKEDASIVFGSSKIHGVALDAAGRVLLFHEERALLPLSQTHSVMWSGSQFRMTVRQDPVEDITFALDGAVTLSRLLYTLAPVHRFTLGSGNEMVSGGARPKKGRVKDSVKQLFEPTVQVAHGSVGVTIKHAIPPTESLYVKPHEPLSLLAAALVDMTLQDKTSLLTALGERVIATDKYLGILSEISRSVGDETLTVTVRGRPVFPITRSASSWLGDLMRIPEHTYTRRGELYAADLHRYWCRIQFDDQDPHEDWTFRFTPYQSEKVKQAFNSRVTVQFRARVTGSASSGTGVLVDIERAP